MTGFFRLFTALSVAVFSFAVCLRAEEASTGTQETAATPSDTVPAGGDPGALPPESAPPEEEEDVGSRLSFSAGFDLATAYFFRGIPQEVNGYIFQPYANLGISLYEPDPESSLPIGLGLSFGTWNSIHSNLVSNPWYESDFSAGLSISLPAGISTGLTYVYLYGPSAGDIFAEELDVPIAIDEKELLGLEDMPLGLTFSPSALFVFEIDGGSDGLYTAGDKGIYMQLGLSPSVTFQWSKEYPFTVSVPLTLGLSLDDYYEDSTGGNDTFGFFDLAVSGSFPLSFIPKKFGNWSVTGTVHFLWLGDSAKTIGTTDFGVGGDDFNVYGVVGFAVE